MIRDRKPYRMLLPLLLFLLLIFTSCTDGGAGIFYSIEIEEEIKNRSLPDYLTAFSYATINDMYYLAGGGLYRWNSLTPSQEWSDMSLPSGWKYTWQVASNDSDTLYTILENSDGDMTALYTWNGGWGSAYSLPVGRPYRLWYADSRLYVATQQTVNETDKDYDYRLYQANDATDLSAGFAQVTVGGSPFVSSNKPIRDLAFDTDNAEVLFITSESVYSGTGNTFNTDTAATPSGSYDYLRNIHYSTTHSDIFISTADEIINGDGYVYRWDGTSLTGFSSVGDDPNDFGDIFFGGDYYLLLGAENGYYESVAGSSSFSGESNTIESSANYDITDLSSAVVQGIFDGPGDSFFAMTSGNGLWRNTNGTWSRE
ncbi:hypothetical protein [Marispirochaeta sp.]|uniref:hypothetical protein n=1 Tax=Marispirochaeta sp. TaxID=2038653 RepID=UPI0029C71AFA|nr:hypothetical protein [Marispirochaeta sp.]